MEAIKSNYYLWKGIFLDLWRQDDAVLDNFDQFEPIFVILSFYCDLIP